MNGYIAFYNNGRGSKSMEIHAETLYAAQKEAGRIFGINPIKIHIELAEIDGKQITTTITN